jgi:hypothetical protein
VSEVERKRLANFDNHVCLSVVLHESQIVIVRAVLAIEATQIAGEEQAGLRQTLSVLQAVHPEATVSEFHKIMGEDTVPDNGELGLQTVSVLPSTTA